MSDLEALWRAVLANPDADTPRLAYADCVQESGDEERAELIRVQCGLERLPPCLFGEPGEPRCDQTARPYSISCAACEGRRRSAELLAANRERWEPACGACGGEKFEQHENAHILVGRSRLPATRIRHQCRACSGTGRQPCRWERGFPVVQVPQMRQAWRMTDVMLMSNPPQSVWEPTPWLCALLRTHHVAGVVPGDAESLAFADGTGGTVYLLGHHQPAAVVRQCNEQYETPELATAALGRAVVLAALEWLDPQGAT